MVDIPLIKRQVQETPLSEGRYEAQPIAPTNIVGETISKVADAGVAFYERQLEASANDYAKDAYIQMRGEFNKQFNSGEGENLGLRNIEGYEQFVQGRNRVTETLNKKREELISKEGLSPFARKRAEEKINEAMSTFSYYMDVQEGQVKIADRNKKTALTVQSKTEDLNNFFGAGFNAEDPKTVNLIGGMFKDIRNEIYDSMVDSGTASKTVNDKGEVKYNISNLGQFEASKVMSRIVSEFTENIASQPDGPAKAKVILENYGDYIVPATRNKVQKFINERDQSNEAYKIVNQLVNIEEATSEDYQAKIDELISDNKPELAQRVEKLYPTMLEKKRSVARNLSKGYADVVFKMIQENGFIDLTTALRDSDFAKNYSKIEDSGVLKSVNQFFKPPSQSSPSAVTEMEVFLESGDTDNTRFMKLLSPLSAKDRKTYGAMFTGFGGTEEGKQKAKLSKAYINESVKLLKDVDNWKFPDEEDMEVISDFKTKFIEMVAKEPNLPDPYSKQGNDYLNKFVQAYNDENPLPVPDFKGARKQFNSADAEVIEKFSRKFGRPPSIEEQNYIKKNNVYKDFKTGQVK